MPLQEELLNIPGYEKVIKVVESDSNLTAIIAIHNTTLGPGLGGTRIYPYKNFQNALDDVLKLSKGMTYKAAIAQVGTGGAKSVIIADPQKEKTPELLTAFAQGVNRLRGEYICAEDVGCNPSDIQVILETTKYACGIQGLRGGGDPSVFTAYGTLLGIQSALQRLDGSPSLEGKTVAIQGIGNVGKKLAEFLFWAGANLIISDLNVDSIELFAHQFNAKRVDSNEIFEVPCDVLSPCALGGIIHSQTISRFNCRAIAGCANNQLFMETDADLLTKRNILYAPDFVINGGGLINVVNELCLEGYQATQARSMVQKIYHQLLKIYTIAEEEGISTHQAAKNLAESYIEKKIGKRTQPLCFPLTPATCQ